MAGSNQVASSIFSFSAGLIILALLTFGILEWIGMEVGSFVDWLIGLGAFAWLMTIVTVPWNIHFESQEVLYEAKISREKNIDFDESRLSFVRKLALGALIGAIFLHLASAIFLYWIAWTKISVVGYYGAGAALLLTILRPSIRAYEYISNRLYTIREEVQFPREDVATQGIKIDTLEGDLALIQDRLDIEDKESWWNQVNQKLVNHQELISLLQTELQKYKEENQSEHERISKETHHAVAQLSEDGKFIDNLVEIIRFIKKV